MRDAEPPGADLVRRCGPHLHPDPARVVAQLFVAGEELSTGASRASPVTRRVLALDEDLVAPLLADVLDRFEHRHPHLRLDLAEHVERIGDHLGPRADLSPARRALLGAYSTNEFAVEAAALCNPSIVAHPDQSGLGSGEVRFVLSLRAIGEGHLSSIEFRTGVIGPDGTPRVDDPGPLVVPGRPQASTYDRAQVRALLRHGGDDDEIAALVLDGLPPTFSGAQLDASLAAVTPRLLRRREPRETIERIRTVARSHYSLVFPEDSTLAQRVIRPSGPAESHGMEDARFVRFVDDDGTVTYLATYTAFDGAHVAPQILRTDDFRTFAVSQLAGRAAANKGMALFPRRIGGRFVALSRWDRESNTVTTSADAHTWEDPVVVQVPEQPWELIQIGNCGSPLETDEGWLVITHGVGPMRTYCIGALLLDLDDPTRVVGKLRTPLLEPAEGERDGYVPNVVYSCGAMRHGDTVVLPYAYGDRSTSFALVDLPGLLDRLRAG